ncbi:hypothetical protein DY252_08560 [Thalassospira indica]|uniref:Uncharacterized protein n=1 Tax=Thalassospira indica TaxID=1891279 RepID=A0ABN5NG77_9PROT|nr:hypothetical protein DY252_08560 [Thalassospira indica]
MIKEVYPDPFVDDNRHPKKEYVEEIMELFARAYCTE